MDNFVKTVTKKALFYMFITKYMQKDINNASIDIMPLPVLPKKSLGQNFLNSERVLTRIIEASHLESDTVVVEIGPGLGALTKKLIQISNHVIAVEKDDTLYSMLSDTFHQEIQSGTLRIIHADILEIPIENLAIHQQYAIVANIPYNITGLIFRKFLTTDQQPDRMIILIQKEVVTRILAKDNKESLLSLSVKAYGVPRLVTHVSKGNFTPAPNVDSAVIAIENISRSRFSNKLHEQVFFDTIHAGFAHKRKLVINNLIEGLGGDKDFWGNLFTQLGLRPTERAEDITLDQWVQLSQIYALHKK